MDEKDIKIQKLEQMLLRAAYFIADARGSWDTYQGNSLAEEIAALNIKEKR